MKNSFVLYTDYLEQTEMLSDEQMGILFRAILNYESTGELIDMDDMTRLSFNFIKVKLDRDADKYEQTCEKRREAGRKGGYQKQANLANASKCKQKVANLADNDNDNENDNEHDNDNENENDSKPKRKRKIKEKEPVVYYPNDDKLNRAFADYVDMRKKIKSPMTDRAITLAMNKLKELAAIPFSDMMDNDLAIKILEQSVMNNWKGLFPLKDEDKQSRTQNMAKEVDSWIRQSSGSS